MVCVSQLQLHCTTYRNRCQAFNTTKCEHIDTQSNIWYDIGMDEKTISQEQAAFVLGITRQTVSAMQKRGELPGALTADAVKAELDRQEQEIWRKKRLLAELQ